MDTFLDTTWIYLASGFELLGQALFNFLQNFHFMGAPLLIAMLAMGSVCITKLLSRVIITKRYVRLEKEFHHWVKIRDAAMKCEDKEIGKRMARNIDQAELNRAYYDYFFEGLLLGIATKILPIFFVFAFINEYYKPSQMVDFFGRENVFEFISTSGEPILLGAPFWYFLSLVASYLLWSLVVRFVRSLKQQSQTIPGVIAPENNR